MILDMKDLWLWVQVPLMFIRGLAAEHLVMQEKKSGGKRYVLSLQMQQRALV